MLNRVESPQNRPDKLCEQEKRKFSVGGRGQVAGGQGARGYWARFNGQKRPAGTRAHGEAECGAEGVPTTQYGPHYPQPGAEIRFTLVIVPSAGVSSSMAIR